MNKTLTERLEALHHWEQCDSLAQGYAAGGLECLPGDLDCNCGLSEAIAQARKADAVIEAAPHDTFCDHMKTSGSSWANYRQCNCWKAEALADYNKKAPSA